MAVYTAIPAGGNWNAAATWGGAGFPVAGDTANIPATCLAPVTVNVASACLILNCTGFNSNLVMNAALTIGSGGTCTLPSGASGALTGTGALTLAAGTQTLNTNNKTIPALTGLGSTKTITGTFTVSTTLTITTANVFNGGAMTIPVGCTLLLNSNISGTTTITITGGLLTGSGIMTNPLTWSGSGAITVIGNLAFPNLNHTSYTGTFTINSGSMPTIACTTGNHIVLNASATYASGGAGASIRFGGSVAHNMTSNGVVLPYDISANTSNIRTLLDVWTCGSGQQWTALTSAGTWNGFKWILQGQFNTSAGVSGTTTFEFRTGTIIAGGGGGSSAPMVFNGDVTWNGSLVVGGSWKITYTSGVVNATSGTLSILSSGGTINIGTAFTIGTLRTTSSGNPTNITLNNDLYVKDIAGNSNTYLTFNSLTYNVYCSGSLPTVNVVTLQGTSSIIMNGTGNINNASLSITIKLIIDTAGTITIGAAIIRLYLQYISGNITNLSNTGYFGCYSGVTLDIENIPTRIEVRAMTSSAITLASKLVCKGLVANGAVALNMSGAYDIDCTDVIVAQNGGIYVPNGSTLTVSNSIGLYPTSSTIPSLRALSGIMYLDYQGTYANMKIFNASLVNIDASLSTKTIYTWCGQAVTNCTNVKIVNGSDIGGGSISVSIF